MAREFVPFDKAVIDTEFGALKAASLSDAAKLEYCAGRYEETDSKENPSPAMVRSFEEGFKELRHIKSDYAGRLLFYEPPRREGEDQALVILRVFRKDGQDTPTRERKTAEARMRADGEKRQDNP